MHELASNEPVTSLVRSVATQPSLTSPREGARVIVLIVCACLSVTVLAGAPGT